MDFKVQCCMNTCWVFSTVNLMSTFGIRVDVEEVVLTVAGNRTLVASARRRSVTTRQIYGTQPRSYYWRPA
jgi:hypothetical protein